MSDSGQTFRFGDFELDVAAYELRRHGRSVRLERRGMDLLILLVERRRQLVTRVDIVDRLWGKNVFVDVETGVNTVVSKLRQALHDSPSASAFVETVPGKGYRFIANVEVVCAASPQPSPTVTLAVLPFANLAADADLEYLADGFTEEATTAVGQIDPDHLRVIGRTSVMAYKRTTKSLADIGRELGADYLIEGSIRAEGSRWRVTSTLIRIPDQVQIWSASFDSEPSNMLEFQRELSTAIAEHIRVRLPPQGLSALAKRHSGNADAYDFYLRGRYYWNQLTPATNKRAIEYFERAIVLDPNYALAWSGIADASLASSINSDVPPLEILPCAREAARRAVVAQPDLAEAQASLGYINFLLEWDWSAAASAFHRAIALDPSYALAHRMLGHVLSQTGRHVEARTAMRRARALDPLYAMSHAMSSQIAFQARDYPAAVEHARQSTIVDPDFWIGHVQLGQAYEQVGELDLALQALTNAARLSRGNSKATSFRGYVLAKLQREDETRDVLRMLEAVSRDRYVPPCAIALVHAALGEREAVFQWLNRAYQARDVHLIFLPVDPRWDDFRSERRFETLLSRCGFTSTERMGAEARTTNSRRRTRSE
ncbi:MAG TPA: winged helix-turn-helix domain-containing protein, partial [Vicinamibacterales bacterium]|nr:winged helix-turn-helix domain-containing protein [Vicinamibacterales bacterium]